jgi:hypothetical protein
MRMDCSESSDPLKVGNGSVTERTTLMLIPWTKAHTKRLARALQAMTKRNQNSQFMLSSLLNILGDQKKNKIKSEWIKCT